MLVQFEHKNGGFRSFYKPDESHPFHYFEIITYEGMFFEFLIMPHQMDSLREHINKLKRERDFVGKYTHLTKQFKDTPEIRKAFSTK